MEAHAVHQILRQVPEELRSRIERDILAEIDRAVTAERQRCAGLCGDRADLWRRTLGAEPPSPRFAVEEARARSNEAQYLADLLVAGPDAAEQARA